MFNTEIFSENTASTSEEPTSKETTKKKPKRGKIPSKGKGKGKGRSKKKHTFVEFAKLNIRKIKIGLSAMVVANGFIEIV